MTQYAGADAVSGGASGGVSKVESTSGDLSVTTTSGTTDLAVAKVPAAAVVAGTRITVTTTAGKAKLTGAAVTGLPITAETSATGVALINGTQTILTATVPNDGKVHQLAPNVIKTVTTALTGGTVTMSWTNAAGVVSSYKMTGTAVSGYYLSPASTVNTTLKPGTTVTLKQTTAMTAGAAKVYAKIVII